MNPKQPLSPDLEAQAHELAARIRQRVDDDILALARLLVSKDDAHLFGDTEFQVRDLVHRLGAQAIEERVKKNRPATRGPGSSAPAASKPPGSKATARKRS